MTADCRGPAQLDCRHHSAFDVTEMTIMGGAIAKVMAAENIRHLMCGMHDAHTSHRRHRLEVQSVERALRRSDRRRGHMGVACCR